MVQECLNKEQTRLKMDQRAQKSNTPGSTEPNTFKKVTVEALISL